MATDGRSAGDRHRLITERTIGVARAAPENFHFFPAASLL